MPERSKENGDMIGQTNKLANKIKQPFKRNVVLIVCDNV